MNSLKLNFRLRRIATMIAIAILTLAIIAAISGMAIAFYYQPTATDAHQSLEQIKEIIASIPLIGTILRDILTGGGGINTTTIVHFYTIHSYILSVIAVSLSVIHLVALVIQEQQQKSIFLQQLEKLVTPKCLEKQQTNSENTTQV